MCIIVAKPIGVSLPSKKVFETCFQNNPDGAGLMYNFMGEVVIQKGFMTFTTFWKHLQNLKKKYTFETMSMVFHFRIGTQGKNDIANCHPFPLSDKTDALTAPRSTAMIGVAHNGIISLTSSYVRTEKYSDTHYFVKDYLSLIIQDKTFYTNRKLVALITKLANSKLTILDSDGRITNIGEFIQDDGCFFSNNSYVSYAVSSKNYSFNYSVNKITVMPADECFQAVPYKNTKSAHWKLRIDENFVDRYGNIYRWSYMNPQFLVKIFGYYAVKNETNRVSFDVQKAFVADVIEFLGQVNDDEMDSILSEESILHDEFAEKFMNDYDKADSDIAKKEFTSKIKPVKVTSDKKRTCVMCDQEITGAVFEYDEDFVCENCVKGLS